MEENSKNHSLFCLEYNRWTSLFCRRYLHGPRGIDSLSAVFVSIHSDLILETIGCIRSMPFHLGKMTVYHGKSRQMACSHSFLIIFSRHMFSEIISRPQLTMASHQNYSVMFWVLVVSQVMIVDRGIRPIWNSTLLLQRTTLSTRAPFSFLWLWSKAVCF